jgi:hypothetical protein
MKELYLRNFENCLYKLDKNRKYSVYYDPINNNLILFNPMDDCSITSVCDATVSDGAYDYLINVLNVSGNVLVVWSEVSGTTSDYMIFYDFDVFDLKEKPYKEIVKILPNSNIPYKFQEYKDNQFQKIKFG